MPELQERLQADLATARKSRDKAGTLLLGTVLSDIKNRRIELGHELSDEEVRDVLRRAVKRRRESVEAYQKAGRQELADNESAEITRLSAYLPANVSDDEIRDAARAAVAGGATNIGAVMGVLMPRFRGRAEGATINRIAREELEKQSA
ncbi:MAG TPA: GatB/YqeY domain-containing protein [Gemmatimonadaceae bacterium]|nr:GatB/YqeY domain-containing protein [Gemmatimonadaceae bacterium]